MNRNRIGFALSVSVSLTVLFAAACTPAGKTTAASATPPATATRTVSATPAPPTLTPSLTPTPVPPVAAAEVNAFCRFGPSQYYAPTGELLAGETSPISGRNEDSTWWVIPASYEGGECWIADNVVTVSGDVSQVAVIAAPPLVPLAPVPIHPIGKLECDPHLPHIFLRWEPVDHPEGIALYEWELQGPEGWEAGTTGQTHEERVIVCGERYRWRVRAIDNEGTSGPFSELVEFEME